MNVATCVDDPPHLGEPDPLIGIRAEHYILHYIKLQPQYICLARLKIQLGENLPSAPFFADDKEVRQLDTLRRTVQFWADYIFRENPYTQKPQKLLRDYKQMYNCCENRYKL